MIERSALSAIAHTDHPIAAPLSDPSVQRVLQRGIGSGPRHLLDLGCATGEWLARAAVDRPDISAVGVDLDAAAIATGRRRLSAAGLDDRVELTVGDATAYSGRRADCVLSVGAAHAFGGLLPTLASVRPHLAKGATVLIGDGFWQRDPTDEVLAIGFGRDEFADLATTVARVTEAGWAPIYGHVSSADEWDDYEWSWSGSLTEWGLNETGPDRSAALTMAQRHRNEWLGGYRGVLGFVTLVLRSTR